MAYSVSIVLAVVMGYLMANPEDLTHIALVGAVVGLMVLPVLIRWYHVLMVFSVNALITFSFLPGRPDLWVLAAGAGLVVTLVNRSMVKLPTSLHVPAVSWSLILLAVVTLLTAFLTTGIGFRIAGSEYYGGKRYIIILAAIMAYFVLVSKPIPVQATRRYFSMFCLSALTGLVSNLIYLAGPGLYILYYIFPAELAVMQASADVNLTGAGFVRMTGLAVLSQQLSALPIAYWGVRGLLDIRKPWRGLWMVALLLAGLFTGYRSILIFICVLLFISALLEGLLRWQFVPIFGGLVVALLIVVLPNANHLPQVLQRSLSVLPFANVDAVVAADSAGSSEWRLQMWNYLLPQVPKNLILGRGFGIDATQHYLLEQSAKRGHMPDYEVFALTGDFHNGPLSVLLPLGLFGLLTFMWFCSASLWVLVRNFRYGDPERKRINTVLLALFLSKLLVFCTVFGALHIDLPFFVGLIGLSISMNGVSKPPRRGEPAPAPVA